MLQKKVGTYLKFPRWFSMSLIFTSATDLAKKIKSKEIKAVEALQEFRSHSDKMNSLINAYVKFDDTAKQRAEQVDKDIAAGKEVGPLAGVPISMKDMFCTKGIETTAASKILKGFIPPYSATVVNRLESAGAVIFAKNNQDEFAMGSSSENSIHGVCKNPWDLQRVPGGSSGGSSAAVAARMSPISFGTDTGGSIRQPASFCGVVGAKPTYGRVSRYGIVSFASSLDQAGPFTNNVADCALATEIVSGKCGHDNTTSTRAVPHWHKALSSDVKGMKIGLPKEYFGEGLGPDTSKVVQNAIEVLKSQGAEVVHVDLPLTKFCVPIYYIIATCEASSNLARYDGVRFGYRSDFAKRPAESLEDFYSRNRGEAFGAEVKRRIMLGTFALSSGYYDAYYRKACQVRRLIKESYDAVFKKCDVIVSPVTTSAAFKIGERINNPMEMYLNDIYTISTNLAGLPGMSVPGGYSQNGLPIGVQITAPHWEEQKMFNAAYNIEQNLKLSEVPSVLR